MQIEEEKQQPSIIGTPVYEIITQGITTKEVTNDTIPMGIATGADILEICKIKF